MSFKTFGVMAAAHVLVAHAAQEGESRDKKPDGSRDDSDNTPMTDVISARDHANVTATACSFFGAQELLYACDGNQHRQQACERNHNQFKAREHHELVLKGFNDGGEDYNGVYRECDLPEITKLFKDRIRFTTRMKGNNFQKRMAQYGIKVTETKNWLTGERELKLPENIKEKFDYEIFRRTKHKEAPIFLMRATLRTEGATFRHWEIRKLKIVAGVCRFVNKFRRHEILSEQKKKDDSKLKKVIVRATEFDQSEKSWLPKGEYSDLDRLNEFLVHWNDFVAKLTPEDFGYANKDESDDRN